MYYIRQYNQNILHEYIYTLDIRDLNYHSNYNDNISISIYNNYNFEKTYSLLNYTPRYTKNSYLDDDLETTLYKLINPNSQNKSFLANIKDMIKIKQLLILIEKL